ncbi:MAG: D-gamma-glutamyl-meso-diaminopimelic acid endopeptidase CwlS [Candidatus Dichloromethanomonas elyunquensis]|nr:MAG: D-gamma-glutamyl-meso-diaminopimelic acid endopeptidase CwlS [Candidatus Dichloromethanomonas elyunquensis]
MNLPRFNWPQMSQSIQGFLKRMPWKSPPVLGGLLFFIILIGAIAINLRPGPVPNGNTVNHPENTFLKEAYQLEINGSAVAFLPSKEDVDKTLEDYRNYYVKPSAQNKIDSVSFAEKVTSEGTKVPASQIQTPDQVLQLLIAGNAASKDYTVQANDSWWLIARKNDMMILEVLAGNPGATEDTKLIPGQVIKLVSVTPYLNVISSGTVTETESIPYDTVIKTDNSLENENTKVVTEGSNGSKLVTYSYEQKNGTDLKRQVLNEQITVAAITKVVAKGPSRAMQVASRGSEENSRGSADSSGLVDFAESLVGTPYVFGGTTTAGFDCSGFTKYVFGHYGISLPRTSFAQFASGSAISRNELQPGDLVFFTTYSKGASHVGIYIGGGRFVHADNPRVDVTITSLNDGYYSSRYLGARRY